MTDSKKEKQLRVRRDVVQPVVSEIKDEQR